MVGKNILRVGEGGYKHTFGGGGKNILYTKYNKINDNLKNFRFLPWGVSHL